MTRVWPCSSRRDVEARHARHLHVRDEHVGSMLADHGERGGSVTRLCHDLDVALERKQCSERAEHHALVLGDDDSDLLCRHPCSRADAGRLTESCVPIAELQTAVPPSASARVRMLRIPTPSSCVPPRPSSEISNR